MCSLNATVKFCVLPVVLCCLQAPGASGFMLGVDVFLAGYTHYVRGYRVGLITNQTGRSAAGSATVDLLHRHPNVNLTALFAPEHGIRGVIPAGEEVAATVDQRTGLPVHTLYGANSRRPSHASLANVDVLIYDIQDVGSRAYTYIWSMVEAMSAAAETGKAFIVLDRPNPLGGGTCDGPVTEQSWKSFLGLYPVPRVYGLTPGEFARYINGEHQLHCRLVIMPMADYQRDMDWQDTGLVWTPPSPNIPSVLSAMCFAATGTIGVLGSIHIGIGTPYPFQLVLAPWIDAVQAAERLNHRRLPGVAFEAVEMTPAGGLFSGVSVGGVRLVVTSAVAFRPAETEIHLLSYLASTYPNDFTWDPDRFDRFDKAMGTSSVRRELMAGTAPTQIIRGWSENLQAFAQNREQYQIYP